MQKSLQHLAQYQADYYRRMFALPYFPQVANVIENYLRQIVDYGAFYLRVHTSALPAILASGCVKSMMETYTGATNGGVETRKEVVKILFNCDTGSMRPEDYPKFGFLSQPDAVRDFFFNGGMWCQYGAVSIQLKKERLLRRTTLCVGDSVNMGRYFTLIPTPVDSIKATCICGLEHDGTALVAPPEPLMCYYYIATLILEKKLTHTNFPLLEAIAREGMPVFEFFELQYHGAIDLATDVERIDVEPLSAEDEKRLLALKPQFEAMGIPFHLLKDQG